MTEPVDTVELEPLYCLLVDRGFQEVVVRPSMPALFHFDPYHTFVKFNLFDKTGRGWEIDLNSLTIKYHPLVPRFILSELSYRDNVNRSIHELDIRNEDEFDRILKETFDASFTRIKE